MLKKEKKLKENKIICSFCGRDCTDISYVNNYFSGIKKNIYICQLCVEVALSSSTRTKSLEQISEPLLDFDWNRLKQILDERIVANDKVKCHVISLLVYHCWRLTLDKLRQKNTTKQHCLIIGDTGIGKTSMLKIIAEKLNLPFAVIDTSSITKSGFVGEDISIIATSLIDSADGDVVKAENGIVILDEIDKICSKSDTSSMVNPTNIQSELLCLLEGKKLSYGGPLENKRYFNTENITFFALGSFAEVRVKLNQYSKNSSLFLSSVNDKSLLKKNENQNLNYFDSSLLLDYLRDYGMYSELLGRFQSILLMDSLTKNDFITMLKLDSYNPVFGSIKDFLAEFNVFLTISEKAIDFLAEKALKLGLGARGLFLLLNSLVCQHIFKLLKNKNSEYKIKYLLDVINDKLVVLSDGKILSADNEVEISSNG